MYIGRLRRSRAAAAEKADYQRDETNQNRADRWRDSTGSKRFLGDDPFAFLDDHEPIRRHVLQCFFRTA